jgi:hypothetical protein
VWISVDRVLWQLMVASLPAGGRLPSHDADDNGVEGVAHAACVAVVSGAVSCSNQARVSAPSRGPSFSRTEA